MKGRSGRAPDRAKDRTDWTRIARLTETQIERMAARDGENPATRKDDWANAFIGVPPRRYMESASKGRVKRYPVTVFRR